MAVSEGARCSSQLLIGNSCPILLVAEWVLQKPFSGTDMQLLILQAAEWVLQKLSDALLAC